MASQFFASRQIVLLLLVGPYKSGKSTFCKEFKKFVETNSYIDVYIILGQQNSVIYEISRQIFIHVTNQSYQANSTFILIDKNMASRRDRIEMTTLATAYNATVLQLFLEFDKPTIFCRNRDDMKRRNITSGEIHKCMRLCKGPKYVFFWEHAHFVAPNYLDDVNESFGEILNIVLFYINSIYYTDVDYTTVNFQCLYNRIGFERHILKKGEVLPYVPPLRHEWRGGEAKFYLEAKLDCLPLSIRCLRDFLQRVAPRNIEYPSII